MARKATGHRRPTPVSAGRSRATGSKSGKSKPAPKKAVVKGPRSRARADAKAAAGATAQWSEADVVEAFTRLRTQNPEPKGELEYANPFTLLVSVVLSAQATDAGVNKATRPLFAQVQTPQAMLDFGEDRLREAIRSLGFFRVKARNVMVLAQKLVAEHDGEVPRTREALEALPGAGRKTANVVLNTAFGEPTIGVDTHVFRVSNRTGLAPGRNPLEVEAKLEEVVPGEFKLHAHHWLILHGRYVCKALRPLCERCVINDLCGWPGKLALAAAPTSAVAT